MQFHIPDMACEGCARSITLAVRAVDPDAVVTATLDDRRIEIGSGLAPERFAAALADIGYPPATDGKA